MTDTKTRGNCAAKCWRFSGLAAVLTFVLLMGVADWGLLAALLVAVVVLVGLGLLLRSAMCGSQPVAGQEVAAPARSDIDAVKPAAPTPPPAAPEAKAAPDAKAAQVDAADPLVRPSAPLAGEAELAARKGSWTYSETAPVADPAPAVEAAPKADDPEAAVPETGVPETDVAAIDVPEDAGPRILPSTPLAGEAELASRKGTWSYTARDTDPE